MPIGNIISTLAVVFVVTILAMTLVAPDHINRQIFAAALFFVAGIIVKAIWE